MGDTVIDIRWKREGPEHIAELSAAIEEAGYTHERVL